MNSTKLKVLTVAMALSLSATAFAQTHPKRGHTQIIGDVAVQQLVEKHQAFNERVKTIPGFRIQIAALSGNNAKARAFGLKQQFAEMYPDVPIYLIYDEPNFRIKVGDFLTKLDAYSFLQKIKATYPGTIVKDNIYPIRLDWNDLIPETDADAEE